MTDIHPSPEHDQFDSPSSRSRESGSNSAFRETVGALALFAAKVDRQYYPGDQLVFRRSAWRWGRQAVGGRKPAVFRVILGDLEDPNNEVQVIVTRDAGQEIGARSIGDSTAWHRRVEDGVAIPDDMDSVGEGQPGIDAYAWVSRQVGELKELTTKHPHLFSVERVRVPSRY